MNKDSVFISSLFIGAFFGVSTIFIFLQLEPSSLVNILLTFSFYLCFSFLTRAFLISSRTYAHIDRNFEKLLFFLVFGFLTLISMIVIMLDISLKDEKIPLILFFLLLFVISVFFSFYHYVEGTSNKKEKVNKEKVFVVYQGFYSWNQNWTEEIVNAYFDKTIADDKVADIRKNKSDQYNDKYKAWIVSLDVT